MRKQDLKIVRDHLDQKLEPLKGLASLQPPEQGWVKTLRESMGMSAAQLGARAGLHQSRVARLEAAETQGNLKLSSLKKLAKGLGLKFVYGFVPEESLEDTVRAQAGKVARKHMQRLETTMKLEEQGLEPSEGQKALDVLVEKIVNEDIRTLWNE